MKESTRQAVAEEVERLLSDKYASHVDVKRTLISGALIGLGFVCVVKAAEMRENRKNRKFQEVQ